jgi:hypothetical protein
MVWNCGPNRGCAPLRDGCQRRFAERCHSKKGFFFEKKEPKKNSNSKTFFGMVRLPNGKSCRFFFQKEARSKTNDSNRHGQRAAYSVYAAFLAE